jgi:hypothetical protein
MNFLQAALSSDLSPRHVKNVDETLVYVGGIRRLPVPGRPHWFSKDIADGLAFTRVSSKCLRTPTQEVLARSEAGRLSVAV